MSQSNDILMNSIDAQLKAAANAGSKGDEIPDDRFQLDGGTKAGAIRSYSMRYLHLGVEQTLAKIFVTESGASHMYDTFANKTISLPEYTERWLVNRACLNHLFSDGAGMGQLIVENLGEFDKGGSQHNDVHASVDEIVHYQCTQVASWAAVAHSETWASADHSLLFWLPTSSRAAVLSNSGGSCPTALRLDARKDGEHFQLVATTWYSNEDAYLFSGWKQQQQVMLSAGSLQTATPRQAGEFATRTPISRV